VLPTLEQNKTLHNQTQHYNTVC